jgi:transcriptional regulator with XRE-family HTH domain
MRIQKNATDETILAELGSRLASARLGMNLTQIQLAEQAGVSKSTVQRLELGEAATQLSGFIRVCRVLGLVERFETFLPESSPSPMTQLKLQGKKRQRARGGKGASKPSTPWTWGETT